jgi:hypothetical protein
VGESIATWLLGLFLLWVLIATFYLHGLRRMAQARETQARRGIAELALRVSGWRRVLESLGQREWREAAATVERALEALTGHAPLAELLDMASEVKLLFQEHRDTACRAADAMSIQSRERAAELDRAFHRLATDVARYNASAMDAAFACERFPLSLLAMAVGLRKLDVVAYN